MINSPIDFERLLFENSKSTATAMNGTAKAPILTFTPKMEIIHAVNVVPTLAPIITAIDCWSDINPAFTKLTTITVEAEELCMRAVMRTPVATPEKRFRVMADSMVRIRSPATFCRPSDITFMP